MKENKNVFSQQLVCGMELPVYIISQDLLLTKFFNGLGELGFDEFYYRADPAEILFRLGDFAGRPTELYELYLSSSIITAKRWGQIIVLP